MATREEILARLIGTPSFTLPTISGPIGSSVRDSMSDAARFSQRVMGDTAPAGIAAMMPAGSTDRFRQVVTGQVPPLPSANDPAALSKVTQFDLAHRNLAPTEATPMATPNVDVQAAAPLQLNPALARVGQSGGMAASGANPLRQAVLDSQKRQLGLMGDQATMTGELGQAQAGRMLQTSDREAADAETRAQLAAQQQQDEADAAKKTEAVVAYQQKMIDDLATRKVDPTRVYRNMDTGTKIATTIGAVAAGMLQGLQGGSNQVIDRLDRMAQQDIDAQLAEIDNQKASIHGRQNLVNQMIQLTGDRRAGALAAKNILFEAMKQSAQAYAERVKIPEVMKNTELLVNAVNQHQEVTTGGWAQQAYDAALRAQQAASAARLAEQKRLEEQRRWDLEYKLKERSADADLLKATGTTNKDIGEEAGTIAKQLQSSGIVEVRARAERAKASLNRSAGSKDEALIRSVLPRAAANSVLPQKTNDREQDYNDFMAAAMKATYGNVTASESVRAEASYGSTGDPATRKRSIENVLKIVEDVEKNAMATASPAGQQEYLRRRAAADGSLSPRMPDTVQVKK